MRVGHRHSAGFQVRRLVLLVAVLLLAAPAAATAQEPDPEPAPITFTQAPSGERPPADETVAFAEVTGAEGYACAVDSGFFRDCDSPETVEPLPGGRHVFTVRALDATGATIAEGSVDWVVLALEEPTITGGPGTEPTSETAATFEFSAPGALGYECQLDRGTRAACSSPLALTGLADGRHELHVWAIDAARAEAEAVRAWTVDTRAPVITVVDRPRPVEGTLSYGVRFTVADTTAVTLSCELNGTALESCTPGTRITGTVSRAGRHVLLVTATDALGRESVESVAWEVDLDGPVVSFTTEPPAATPAATVELAYGASGAVPGFTCLLDDVPFADCDGSSTVDNASLGLGRHTFRVSARDALGNEGTRTAEWVKPAFEAAFDWAPAAPVVLRPVTFTSRSVGDVADVAWDLDGDGDFDDARGTTVEHTFSTAGVHVVRLRATHPSGVTDDATAEVTVGRTPLTVPPGPPTEPERKPPVAAFDVAPTAPVAGQEVTLTSTSSDPDGSIAGTTWDLDGDGAFDDASGPAATRAFPAGVQIIGLRVVDADGLAATAFATITVAAAPGTSPPPPPVIGPKALKLLAPFPTVRIAGTAVGRRIQLRILAVKAPRNTTVEIRCSGRGCPFAIDRHRVAGKARIVRVRRLEGRPLRAGIVLEIRVHAPGRIGKYTRLLMRSGAAPKRTDACVSGTRALKMACPA